jgi:sulfonate transport system ATP-binding protein
MQKPVLNISSLNLVIEEKQLLTNFCLQINKSERVAITGPSGCGKSTFLKSIITGKFPKGSSMESFEKSSKEKYAYTPQKEGLSPWFSLKKNISIFNRDSQLAEKIIDKFGLKTVQNNFPNQLSGGEYQRSTIALALISKPNFLIADEPLTELDLFNKWTMLDFVSNYIAENQATLLLASHDPDTLLYLSDRIIILSDRPSKIETEIKLSAKHPRSIDYLTSDEFNEAKKILLDKIHDPKRSNR